MGGKGGIIKINFVKNKVITNSMCQTGKERKLPHLIKFTNL